MTRATFAGGAFAIVLVLLVILVLAAVGHRALKQGAQDVDSAAATSPASTPSPAPAETRPATS